MKKLQMKRLALLAVVVFFVASVFYVEKIWNRNTNVTFNVFDWSVTIVKTLTRTPFNTGTGHKDRDILNIYANDFDVDVKPLKNTDTTKVAGVVFDSNGVVSVKEQDDLSLIQGTNLYAELGDIFEESLSKSGGVKQFLSIRGNELLLLGLVKGDCVFGLLYNVSSNVEVLRMPCLPSQGADFNGLGGGYIVDEDSLYIAIGAPESDVPKIAQLAQDKKSPYGKVLKFSIDDLGKKNAPYAIYSLGHRNPEGMVRIKEKIFAVEHGPKGGDELNIIKDGNNYGWPIFSVGSSYQDKMYRAGPDKGESDNYSNPLLSFLPSIGVSDIEGCPDTVVQRYKPFGCLLLSSLREGSLFIVIFDDDNEKIISVEKLLIGERIREVEIKNENTVYLVTDSEGVFEATFSPVYH